MSTKDVMFPVGTKRARILDRRSWRVGPWTQEPFDIVWWNNYPTGLPCIARRSEVTGSWCGYTGIPKGHQLYGWGFDEPSDFVVSPGHHCGNHLHTPECLLDDAPGGLTFSGKEPDAGWMESARIHGRYIPQFKPPHRFELLQPIGIASTEPEDTQFWYFGFDTNHALDLMPMMPQLIPTFPTLRPTYKDIAYIKEACNSLANQLVNMS